MQNNMKAINSFTLLTAALGLYSGNANCQSIYDYLHPPQRRYIHMERVQPWSPGQHYPAPQLGYPGWEIDAQQRRIMREEIMQYEDERQRRERLIPPWFR